MVTGEDRAMPDYRIYKLDKEGHIYGPPAVVQCADDQEALKEARRALDGRDIELWQGERFIRKLPHVE